MSTRPKRRSRAARISITVAGALVVLALVAAGCGGSSGGYGGSSSGSSSAGGGSSAVKLASSKLGRILVDSQGRTLYLFQADKGTRSACDGACAAAWPPLTTKGKPSAGAGLSAAQFGTTKRADGSTEVTYHGHPLYTYAGDTAPGQTNGEESDDYGAKWYVLSAAGQKVDAD
jgi:predicted lipoprotein with Yx(FWY)xxD motif